MSVPWHELILKYILISSSSLIINLRMKYQAESMLFSREGILSRLAKKYNILGINRISQSHARAGMAKVFYLQVMKK